MILNDLILEVQNEIESVRLTDIIFALNTFIREHRVSRDIVFRVKENKVRRGNKHFVVTPVTSDLDFNLTSFDYESPLVTFDVVVKENSFRLPPLIVEIYRGSFSINGQPLKSYDFESPVDRDGRGVVIKPTRELLFNFPILANFEIKASGLLMLPTLSVDTATTFPIPFPYHWYSAIRAFVFAELYKKKRYKDDEMYIVYSREYDKQTALMDTTITTYREAKFVL